MNEIDKVRLPAVAGLFYPASRTELAATIRAFLEVGSEIAGSAANPKAVIAPHAGYDYSGPIAGTAFAPLADGAKETRRIVLIGPAHSYALSGLGLPGADAFETPLGLIPVDSELVGRVSAFPQVEVSSAAHAPEHSLEVELPFLQMVLGKFTVLPLVVGQASAEEVAEVLEAVWGDSETRIVVSSDLSHYLPYDDALVADQSTAEKILATQPVLGPYDACGCFCVNGLLEVAGRRGLRPELLDLRNSGDTSGDLGRVVGYGAFAFLES